MRLASFISFLLVLFVLSNKSDGQSAPVLVVRMWYPDANLYSADIMTLRGDSFGLSWSVGQQMTRVQPNCWSYSISLTGMNSTSKVSMKPLIEGDKRWSIGSNFIVQLLSKNSSVDFYPWFYTEAGSYTYVRNVFSPQLNNTRDLVVYLPPSYRENTLKTYTNVLVMHDGQNLFNASTSFAGIAWECQQTLDFRIYNGMIDEVFVIGVDNTDDRINEYTYSYDPTVPGGGNGTLYLDFLEQTVVPLVQQQYRISPAHSSLGILGSSLGGLISCYAGYTRYQYWGRAGCMSSSFWWNNEDFDNVIMAQNPVPPSSLVVYLDSGNAGPDQDDMKQTQTVTKKFISEGFELNQNVFYYLDQGGMHNETAWGNRFWIPLYALYPSGPVKPNPTI